MIEIADAIRIHTEVTGQRPLGWYTGRTSINTVKLVMEAGGFLYSCDSYADDLPYWIKGPAGPHLIIPYSLDVNDMRFVNAAGVWWRRPVLYLSQRQFRCVVRGRRNVAQDDVGGIAPAGSSGVRAARHR